MINSRPLATALVLQAGIIGLAIALAWLFGLTPWHDLEWSGQALLWSLLATLPLVAMLLFVPIVRWRWAREVTHLIEAFLVPLFARAPVGSIVLVSLLAGIGEELLFRGVIQEGLSGRVGPLPALVIASLLFGLAHAVSRAYFIIATALGLYLGWLYMSTGNLLIPILVHALYDWVAIHYYLRRRVHRVQVE